ncbi:type I phosphomannose isomerase catalytic subunit [Alicyclobacillus fodiniaquatilis]|uniref:Phosphohexomutase n=1 Tax=Alicyclobacillus fodiniaquatilis TaxID=1661150 RepID=A0ABW4JHR7_9BACL
MYQDMAHKILRLSSTRVWRTYDGGAELERWQGGANPQDGTFPEEWIASVVKARNPARDGVVNEGLSEVLLANGETVLLKDLIDAEPRAFLGDKHCERYGDNPAVLVKVIDSLGRLTIQVHPDKQFAKAVFGSDYGKTEAWYILGGREVNGEAPYVLLGFKPGVTRESWQRLFATQDIAGMMNALHKIPVHPGEIYLIEGGVPHAIGSGCFLIEIQEPTDYTIRLERTTPQGNTVSDEMCHQGAGFEKIFDCFHYDTLTLDETLQRWRISAKIIHSDEAAEEAVLIGEDSTSLFGMNRLSIKGRYAKEMNGSFAALIVVSGAGQLHYGDEQLAVKQGDTLFIPAAVAKVGFESADGDLEIIMCFPPAS